MTLTSLGSGEESVGLGMTPHSTLSRYNTVLLCSSARKKGVPGRTLFLGVCPGLGWVVLDPANCVTGSPTALLLTQPGTSPLL